LDSKGNRSLLAIGDRLAPLSERHAFEQVERIRLATVLLEEFPLLGRMVPDYDEPDFRELIVDVYRVFYLLMGEDVLVVAIEDARRSIRRALGHDPWSIV
jgi:toxin ParE1/3/4